MRIDLSNLPDEGQQYTGELSPEIFQIEDTDIISVSPAKYDLHVQRFDSELLLTGCLQATFELTCQRSLEPFFQTIFLPSTAISIEIKADGLIDPSNYIREEILLELPTIPRCDEGDTPIKYEIDPKYLAENHTPTNQELNSPHGKPDPWADLDNFEPKK